MYFMAPPMYILLKMNPRYRRPSVFVGFAIIVAALVGASFAKTVGQLIATQGVLYAIGGALHYYPVLLYLDEWFVQRKGFAFGVICASCGLGAVAITFTLEWLLHTYGFRTALRVWAVVYVVLTTPALFFMKPRLPVRHHANVGPQRVPEMRYLKARTFWILQGANIIQGLGYFLPSVYLSSFAQAVGFSSVDGTLAISLINAAQIVGAMFIGYLCDRCHVTTAILVCSLGTVVAVFGFWTFATFKPLLYIFAIFYGITASGYSTTWSAIAKPIRESYPGTESGMIIALFSCGKGIGAVVSGPLSEALVEADHWNSAPYAFGSGYGTLIVATGVTALVGGASWYAKQFKLLH